MGKRTKGKISGKQRREKLAQGKIPPLVYKALPSRYSVRSHKSVTVQELGRALLTNGWTRMYTHGIMGSTWVRGHSNKVSYYHGTSIAGAYGIAMLGFLRPAANGMLGSGVYLGDYRKARAHGEVVFECVVDMGEVITVTDTVKAKTIRGDTIYCPAGARTSISTFLRNEEWCVRDPSRITLVGVTLPPVGWGR